MSLIAWYPLIRDLKNQGLDGNNLTQSSTAITYTGGLYGYSATFNNNANQCLYRPKIDQNKNITIAGWFKYTDTGTQIVLFNCANGQQNNDGWSVWLGSPSHTLYYQFGNVKWNYANNPIAFNTWFHLAVVVDDNSVYRFYLNGEQLATGTVTTLPDYSEGDYISLGAFKTSSTVNQPLSGQAQDFRIYDHALSTKEIKELAKGLILHHDLKGYGASPNVLPSTLISGSIEEEGYRGQTVYVRDITTTTENYIAWGRIPQVEQSTQYTFSCYLWTNDNVKSVDFYWLSDTETNQKTGGGYVNVTSKIGVSGITPNQWNYLTWTFTTKADDYTGFIRVDNNGSKTEGEHAILKACCPKLEKGSKATPYIPHDLIDTDIEDDLSGNGYNGTRQGVTFTPDSPRYYMSTEFNADKDLLLDRIFHQNDEVGNLSVSIWANFSASYVSGTNNCLWNLNQNQFFRIERTSNTNINCVAYMGSATQNFAIGFGGTIAANTWYHIVTTFDKGIFKLYVNGTLASTTDKTSVATTLKCANSTSRWAIGDFTETANEFIGKLSDFRIYAKTLTADDVTELYKVGAQVDKTGKLYCGELVEE